MGESVWGERGQVCLGVGGGEEKCVERYGDGGGSKGRCGDVKIKCGEGMGECMG